MSTLRFSVALATFNGARFLREQLDSLARQTLLPYELVACDDGSSDSTASILEDFAREAPFPVRIYRNEQNTGHGDTFFKAASHCHGEWIAFCDQDDIWLDHKLARVAEVIAAFPQVVLVSHSAEQVDAALNRLPHRIPDHRAFSIAGPLNNQPLSVLPGFTCSVLACLVKALPIEHRPEDIIRAGRKQPHDRFIYHVADTYGHIARIPDSLVLYRRHEQTVTGSRGSGVYDRSLAKKFRSGTYAREEGFLHMASQARQHCKFYECVLKRAGGSSHSAEFVQRTLKAIDRYRRVAEAFEARAVMYAPQTGRIERARLFAQNLSRGAYTGSPTGRSLGWKALTKDLARVAIAW
jgi:glycosyltransferase involved in cell wall biosynthesis